MCIVDPLIRSKLLYSEQGKLGQAWPWRRSQEQGIRLTRCTRWIYVDWDDRGSHISNNSVFKSYPVAHNWKQTPTFSCFGDLAVERNGHLAFLQFVRNRYTNWTPRGIMPVCCQLPQGVVQQGNLKFWQSNQSSLGSKSIVVCFLSIPPSLGFSLLGIPGCTGPWWVPSSTAPRRWHTYP